MENNENNNVQPTVEENKPLESTPTVNSTIEQPKVEAKPSFEQPKGDAKPEMPNNPKEKKNNKKIITVVTCSAVAVGLIIGAFFIGRSSNVTPTPEPQPQPVVETTYTVVLVPGEGHFGLSSLPILINDVKKDTKLNEIKGYSVPTHELLDFSNWLNKGVSFDATSPIVENTVLVANFIQGPRYAKSVAKQELDKQLKDNTQTLIDHGEGEGEAQKALEEVHLSTIKIIDSNIDQSTESIEAIKNLSSDVMNKVADTDTALEQRLKVSESYNHLCNEKLDDDLSADELVVVTAVMGDYIQVIEEDPEIDETNIKYMDAMFDDIKTNVKKSDKKKKKISKNMSKGAIKSASKVKDDETFELLEGEVLKNAEEIYKNPELKEEDVNELSDLSNSYVGALSKANEEEMEKLEGYYDSTKTLYLEVSKDPTELNQMVYKIRKDNLDGFSNLDNGVSLEKTIDSAVKMEELFEEKYQDIKDASTEKKEDYTDIAHSFSKAITHQEDTNESLLKAVNMAYNEMLDDEVYEIVKDDVMYGMKKIEEMPSMDSDAYLAGANFDTFNEVLQFNVNELKQFSDYEEGRKVFKDVNNSLYDSMLYSDIPARFAKSDINLAAMLEYYKVINDKATHRVLKENDVGDSLALAGMISGTSLAKNLSVNIDGKDYSNDVIKYLGTSQDQFRKIMIDVFREDKTDMQQYKVAVGKAYNDVIFSQGISLFLPYFITGDIGSFLKYNDIMSQLPYEIESHKDDSDYCNDLITAFADKYRVANAYAWYDPNMSTRENVEVERKRIDEIEANNYINRLIIEKSLIGSDKYADARKIYLENFIDKLYRNISMKEIQLLSRKTEILLDELALRPVK